MTDYYRICWKESAKKELKRLDSKIIQRLLKNVELLVNNPRPNGCKKLQIANNLYRIRVGDYRVVYSINDDILFIEIIHVGHRSNIYQKNLDL